MNDVTDEPSWEESCVRPIGATASMEAGMREVLIVDDQRAFAESLAVVVDAQHDLRCVGICRTGADSVATAATADPDVVLMDIGLPDLDGVEAARRILAEHPSVRVVMLTGRPDAAGLARAAGAGASAFLLKDASVDEILEAVRATSSRRIEVDPAAIQAVLLPGGAVPLGVGDLTQRELEVLAGLGDGQQPKQIARQLGITVPTCRGHIKALFQKLGAHTALEAVVLAHRYGIMHLPADDDGATRTDRGS